MVARARSGNVPTAVTADDARRTMSPRSREASHGRLVRIRLARGTRALTMPTSSFGSVGVVCAEPDECHDAGACIDYASGACDEPSKPDGTPCSTGTCAAGACTSSSSSGSTSSSSSTGGTSSSSSGGGAGGEGSGGGAASRSAGDAGSEGGCGCQVAGGGGAPGATWIGVLALALALAASRKRLAR